jgi:hypothetical protein
MKHAILGAALVLFVGCGGSRVLMPARVNLQSFQRIGFVEFTSNAEGNLQTLASQQFIQRMQSSQPGVPVLELGDRKKVLDAIGYDRIDPDAIQAMGSRFNVDAVIIGNVEVTDVKPKVDLARALMSMDVQADVEAALTTRLMEAGSGATLWTRSSRSKQTVAHAGIDSQGGIHFGAEDPETAYGSLVHDLVYDVTQDFQPYWVKQ